jgi:DNA-binding MarR family transcriptional regulator
MTDAIANKFIEAMFKNSRLLREKSDFSSDVSHLSILQMQTLSLIKRQSKLQMSEIAEYFNMELPSATSLLNKLVTLQLVERQKDPNDRRMVRVILTTEGNTLLKEVMKKKANHIEKMLSFLTKEEQAELLRLVEKLNSRIENHYEH